jgi:hypothetical protein
MFSGWSRYISAVIVVSVLLAGCGGGGASVAPAPTYSVSGKVTSNGTGVAGVTVNLTSSNAKPAKAVGSAVIASAVTDYSGTYTFTNISEGTYTVSSADTKYGFDAATVIVSGTTVAVPDRVAYPVFTVTGKITLADGTPLINGTTVVRLYKTSYTIYTIDNTLHSTRDLNGIESVQLDTAFVESSTDEHGVYSFTGVHSGNYTIVPSSSTYVFKWAQVPTRSSIGVVTITDSGMVYFYNPEGNGNQLDGTIIYNTVTPFAIANNKLDGQNFEASLPGGTGGL